MKKPDLIQNTDTLVIESTYGGKTHPATDPLLQLEQVILKTFNRKGILLVPSFAVGRAQTLLYAIYRLKSAGRIPDLPVYLNSPMAISASEIFCRFTEEHQIPPDIARTVCDQVYYVHDAEQSRALNFRTDPMILIAASGMMTGGRILHHLKAFGTDPKNTILFTGFQAAGTRGASLLGGAKEVKIHGEMIPIRAEIASIDTLSTHADQTEILTWLRGFKHAPKDTFITHGEPTQSLALKKAIETELGWNCRVPQYGERVPL